MLVIVFMAVVMRVAVRRFDRMRGYGHDEAAVLHALEADKVVGKLRNARRLAVDDEHFEAGFVVKVGVAGGHDKVVILVLDFSQFFGDAMRVVIVYQRDGAHHRGIGGGRLLSDQAVSDEIAKSLGAVGISAAGDGAVKPLEKVGIERNTDSAENAHACSSTNTRLSRGKARIARK